MHKLGDKKMKKITICLVALLTSACNMNSNAKNIAECENIYQQIEQNAALTTPLQKAKEMEKQGNGCLSTGMYDVWLASFYQDAGDYPASVKIVQSALDKIKTEEARPNLLHLLVEAELATGDEKKAIEMAQAVTHDYPEYNPILLFLIQEESKKENWSKALEYAQQSYKVSHSAISLLASAGALHQLGRHEETVNAVYKALEMEPERIGNVTGVLEAIFSLAILNRRQEAAELAKRHIAANPNWRDNPTFAQAAKELGVTN
jgi:tetratricopeptide (TPR) repeat protein